MEKRTFFIIIGVVVSLFVFIALVLHNRSPKRCEGIPMDMEALTQDLEDFIFGQPFIREIIYILKGFKKDIRRSTSRSITLSFHGTPGVGKTFVSSVIAGALFKGGFKSQYVRKYTGSADFPKNVDIETNREKLRNEIRDIVKQCGGYALIVFDEVHEIEPKVLEVLKAMMDYHDEVNGVDYSKVIFIFLSNLGGMNIAEQFFKLNKPRNKLRLEDFAPILMEAFNKTFDVDNEGFALVNSALIDHYIPFLPLEMEHVKKCIKEELKRKRMMKKYSEKTLNDVLSSVRFKTLEGKQYSEFGCKNIDSEVTRIGEKSEYEL